MYKLRTKKVRSSSSSSLHSGVRDENHLRSASDKGSILLVCGWKYPLESLLERGAEISDEFHWSG